MNSMYFYVPVLVAILAAACGPVAARVKVWEGSMTLPTYHRRNSMQLADALFWKAASIE